MAIGKITTQDHVQTCNIICSGRTDGNIPNGKKLRVASQLLTAIAVDRDHKYLYVTNESGRIFSFVLNKNGSEVCINVNQKLMRCFNPVEYLMD